VAADLVGPGGSVVGLDHSPEALARARYRAGQRGLAQVQFIEGDYYDPAPGGPFDAIVERLALTRFRTRPRSCGGRPPCCARAAWSCR